MLELKDNMVVSPLGDSLLFRDITGTTATNSYGKSGNITYSDVDCVRIKIASYTNMASAVTINQNEDFTQYTEYICTAGNGVVDGKSLGVGDYFIPQSANIAAPSGTTWQTTGFFCYPVLDSWLPNAYETALTLSLSQIGQGNNTLVSDDIYTVDYEVYKDKVIGIITSVPSVQYMVLSGDATYLGNTYYQGEVFIASDASNINSSGYICAMDSTATTYFSLVYGLNSSLLELLMATDGSQNTALQDNIYAIRVQLDAIAYSCSTNNVSYTYTSGLIDRLTSEITYLISTNG